MSGRTGNSPASGQDDLELLDLRKLSDYGGFVLHSLRRHAWVAGGTLAGVLALTIAGLAVFPRTYHVESELLAQKQQMMPALGNPSRTIPGDADAPTRAAVETVRRRDNLVSLVKQTQLLDRYDATRAPIIRVRDWVVRVFAGPPTEEERMDTMVERLGKYLEVSAGERTVTIGIDWREKHIAQQLVETAMQNFLEARHATEVGSIAEAITILERHAAEVQQSVDTALEDVKRSKPNHPLKASDLVALPGAKPPKTKEEKTNTTSEVRAMLEGKRRAIRDLEEFRARKIAELQAELGQQRQVYAEAHPTVQRLKQSVASVTEESPQLAQLHSEERELAAQYAQLTGDQTDREGELRFASPHLNEARKLLGSGADTAADEYAKARLRFAMNKYDNLAERLDAAKIELDTARAAFKYRYSIVRPAELPKGPVKPKVWLVLVLGLFGGLLLAAITAVAVDLKSRKLVERWQIERQLGLPVLGELPRS